MNPAPQELDLSNSNNDWEDVSQYKDQKFEKVWLNNSRLEQLEPLLQIVSQSTTHLDIGYNSLAGITGIQCLDLTNLLCLYLYDNSIQSIEPLSSAPLHNLKCLYLQNNLIEDIEPLCRVNFKRLRLLYLSSNRIVDIQPLRFMDLSSIQGLCLDGNMIHDIKALIFTNLKAVKHLVLSGNRLMRGQVEKYQKLILRHSLSGVITNRSQDI